MITLNDLLVFVSALVVAYLLPGPDMVLVLSTSATKGQKCALLTAVGLAISRATHVTISLMGLAALFNTHPILFDTVRWLGSAYLLLLAWQTLHSNLQVDGNKSQEVGNGWAAIRSGILTNLLNPKALMFCVFLLPQFISTQHSLLAQYLILGTILVGLGFMFDVVYALAAARLAKSCSRQGMVQNLARFLFSGVFGFAAVRLAIGG